MVGESNAGGLDRRFWLAAAAVLGVAFLERFVYYGARSDLIFFLTDAVEAGGLGLTSSAAGEVYEEYRFLMTPAAFAAGIVGFLLKPRITLVLGLVTMALGHLLLPAVEPSRVLLPLATQAAGHGLASVGILAGAGDLFDNRSRRLAIFFMLYAVINLGALGGPTLMSGLTRQGSHANISAVAAGVLAGAALVAVVLVFVRTPPRWHLGGAFRGIYATILFGGALVWFRVLVTVGVEWAYELLRDTSLASSSLMSSSAAAAATVATSVLLAVMAGAGLLARRPCSDNRLTAWGMASGALGMALLILAYQADPARWPLLLGAQNVLASVAETLMYAAVAVLATASGPRLSSLFVGIYLAATSLTTGAVTSLVFSAGMAWALVIVTLLLAAVIGSWHWHEHVAPDLSEAESPSDAAEGERKNQDG